jgi:hypothetical protein
VRRPSLKWATRFAAVGVLVAVTLLLLLQVGAGRWELRTHFMVLEAADVLWPSSFWLLATAAGEHTLDGWMIVVISVAANAALYAVVGAALSALRPQLSTHKVAPVPDTAEH